MPALHRGYVGLLSGNLCNTAWSFEASLKIRLGAPRDLTSLNDFVLRAAHDAPMDVIASWDQELGCRANMTVA